MDFNDGKKVESTKPIEKLVFKAERDGREISFKRIKQEKKKQKEEEEQQNNTDDELENRANFENEDCKLIKDKMEMKYSGHIYKLKSILNGNGVEEAIKQLGELAIQSKKRSMPSKDLYR